jgi:hypothetical protein
MPEMRYGRCRVGRFYIVLRPQQKAQPKPRLCSKN